MSLPLDGLVLFVSASVPKELQQTPRAQHAQDLMVSLVVTLAEQGGSLVFGGHPTITPLIRRLIESEEIKSSEVSLCFPKFFDGKNPDDEKDREVFVNRFAVGSGASPADREAFAADLAVMRNAMAEKSNAALFVGGMTSKDSMGTKTGLIDEWERFRAKNPTAPAFATSLLDGCTAQDLIPGIKSGKYNDHTGLSDERRERLFGSRMVDEVASIVLGQLHYLHTQQSPSP